MVTRPPASLQTRAAADSTANPRLAIPPWHTLRDGGQTSEFWRPHRHKRGGVERGVVAAAKRETHWEECGCGSSTAPKTMQPLTLAHSATAPVLSLTRPTSQIDPRHGTGAPHGKPLRAATQRVVFLVQGPRAVEGGGRTPLARPSQLGGQTQTRSDGCGRLWPVHFWQAHLASQFWPKYFWPKLEVSG